jgi:hypothetical protein
VDALDAALQTTRRGHDRHEPTEIASTNLAKCRASIDRGAKERAAERTVTRFCQPDLAPIGALVAAIRPAAVLCCVLDANSFVGTWRSHRDDPAVYIWLGLTGHDRHNTDPVRQPFNDWPPEAAAAIRHRRGQ